MSHIIASPHELAPPTNRDLRIAIFTGDREWNDREIVRLVIDQQIAHNFDVLVVGDARGLDTMAYEEVVAWNESRDEESSAPIHIVREFAYWHRFGGGAGPERNGRMLHHGLGHDSKVFAFHDDIEHSRGTRNCVIQAQGLGFPGVLVKSDGLSYVMPQLAPFTA